MSDFVDPNAFIISRKRKKYRFALFHNASNCFELDEWTPLEGKNNISIEVGAGTGLFSVELARRHPEMTFIALDVKADRLQKGARRALETRVENVFFVRARADQLLEVARPQSITVIWVTFPDPFPKKRDAKRRLLAPSFLELYKKIHVLKNAKLYFKTDSHALFDWSLGQLVISGWHIDKLSYDLHESAFSSDFKIMTTYEKKWTDEGLPIYFVATH